MFKRLIFSLFFLAKLFAYDITNCGSYFTFEDLEIEGCHYDDFYCKLIIGSEITVTFKINSGVFDISDAIFNNVGLMINGGPYLGLGVTPEEVCDILRCPIVQDYEATISVLLRINSTLPPLANASLKWIMETAANEQLLCFSVPALVVN